MGARQSRGEVLANGEDGHIRQVIVCDEKQCNCVVVCGVLNYFPNAPQFNTSAALNHEGLISCIDDGRGSGSSEVGKKFNDLHEKLQKKHVNACFWAALVILALWWAIEICLLVYMNDVYGIQCKTTNVCNISNVIICQPDETKNEYISRNTSFNSSWCLDCEDIHAHEYTGKERSVYCGDINLFAEFLILPGRYASPEFIGNVYRYSYIISLCIVISGFSYAYYRTRKVNSIIQNHFQDWQERGIMVEYHPAKHGYTRRGLSRYEGHVVRGHLDLTLPPIQAVASPPYPTS